MRKQVKTLVKYQKPNNIINVCPIFEDEECIIEKDYIIIGDKKEIHEYLEGKVEEWELSETPFGIDKDEYFRIYDGIVEEDDLEKR